MTTVEIEKLAAWCTPKEVNTKFGRRLLRKAAPTDAFSAAWRASKAMPANGDGKHPLQAAGVGWSKDERTGQWECVWWQPVSAEQAAKENAAIAASRATDAAVNIPAPDGLAYLPFQRAGIAFMRDHPNCLLADEMGLGKTIQAIGGINLDASARRVLVVCPASLKVNWRNELAKWLVRPLKVAVQAAGQPWVGSWADVVVVNYDILSKFKEIYQTEWDVLIADEAHFVKNPKAQRTKLLLGANRKGDKETFPGVRAKVRRFLTGTPLLNRPIELFPLLESLEPGKWTFRDKVRYCAGFRGQWGWDFTGAAYLDELQRRLRSTVMCRRLKKEVLTELPAKRRQIVELPANGDAGLCQEECDIYDQHEATLINLKAKAAAARLADDEAAYREAADALKRAHAVAFAEVSKVRHQVALAKVPKVVEHVEDALEETAKLVLFAHHLDVIAQYQAALAAYGVAVVTGDTKQELRQGVVDGFNTDPKTRVLILGIKAAGVGLSVRASLELFAELDWTPGGVSQAEDRCHGVGRGIEGEPLLIQHMVLEGSQDARMVRTIVQKQDIADRALDKGAGLAQGAEPVLAVELDSVLSEGQPEGGSIHQPGQKSAPAAAVAPATGALAVTEELRAHVHQGLRMLAGVCDYANQLDGCGFNKLDAAFGHALAERTYLTDKMVPYGVKICIKYRRQLGAGFGDRLAVLTGKQAEKREAA